MPVFRPRYRFGSIMEITPEFMKEHSLKAAVLDVDNTLAVYEQQTPAKGVPEWIDLMKEIGIRCIIVSNNDEERVAPFAEQVGLPFITKAGKPLGSGIRKACAATGTKPSETVMIGDQIFTDILGGNLHGLPTVLVEPFELETSRFFRLKRWLERRIVKRKEGDGE